MEHESAADQVALETGEAATSTRLRYISHAPPNAESVLANQTGVITPNPAFYIRSHFAHPLLTASEWRLTVEGEVRQPRAFSYDALRSLPERTLLVTLECAGNGRIALHPPAEGEPWHYGAVSTAEWSGVPLRTVLEEAGVLPGVQEVVIEGADQGYVAAANQTLAFTRSLPIEQALHPDTLLAYAMNGEALPVEHGFPVRLIVPGWYGMAAVKWVRRIHVIAHHFQGFYQTDRYIMALPGQAEADHSPLTTIGLRSLITTPTEGSTLPRGRHRLRGLAWSGAALLSKVEVSVDQGTTWEPATFTSEPARYAWRGWEYLWQAETPGPIVLQSKAFDASANAQPAEAPWNRLGYANTAIQRVPVLVL